MTEKTIEIEANSLAEALEQLQSQIPEGLLLLSKTVVSDGKPKTPRFTSQTTAAAFLKAQDEITNGAEILEKRELRGPENEIIPVEAFDEQTARAQAEIMFPKSSIIKSLKLVRLGRKGFWGIARKPNQYEVEILHQAVVEIIYKPKAKISAQVGEKKEAVINMAQRLSKGWPDELPRDVFDDVKFDELLERLRNYQRMPHPGSIRGVHPTYQIINGSIARIGDSADDFLICTVADCISGRDNVTPFDERASRYAGEVIQRYVDTKLARFLFLLPKAERMSEGEKLFVAEDSLIDVYKGVENVLFEIHQELGEGEVSTDETVRSKLLSIIERSATSGSSSSPSLSSDRAGNR